MRVHPTQTHLAPSLSQVKGASSTCQIHSLTHSRPRNYNFPKLLIICPTFVHPFCFLVFLNTHRSNFVDSISLSRHSPPPYMMVGNAVRGRLTAKCAVTRELASRARAHSGRKASAAAAMISPAPRPQFFAGLISKFRNFGGIS